MADSSGAKEKKKKNSQQIRSIRVDLMTSRYFSGGWSCDFCSQTFQSKAALLYTAPLNMGWAPQKIHKLTLCSQATNLQF